MIHILYHSTDAEEHFAFVLTDLDGKFRFGLCRYPAKGDTCMCFLRYISPHLVHRHVHPSLVVIYHGLRCSLEQWTK